MKNFFRKLLPSKPVPLTLEQQVKSLDEQSQDFLANLVKTAATNENDSVLRLAAVEHLSFGSQLVSLAVDEHTKTDIKKAARLKLSKMLDDKSISLADLAEKINNNHVLIAITHFCKSDEFHNQLISSVTDSAAILELCLSNIPVATKQILAERISDEATLKELAKSSKSKEKAVYKIVKAKIDVIKASAQAKLDAENNIQQTLSDIQHHAQRQLDVVYAARLDVLVARWEGLESYSSEADQKLYAAARNQCLELLAIKTKKLSGEQISGSAKDDANTLLNSIPTKNTTTEVCVEGSDSGFAEIPADEILKPKSDILAPEIAAKANEELKKLWYLVPPMFLSGEIVWADIKTSMITLNAEWETLFCEIERNLILENQRSILLKSMSIIEEYTTRYESLHAYIHMVSDNVVVTESLIHRVKLLDKLMRGLSKLSEFELSSEMVLLKEKVINEQQLIANKKQQDEKNLRIIGSLIRKASSNVEKGQLKTAVGVRRSIQHKMEHLTKPPVFIARQIEELDLAVAKLIDWQNYAVLPKKQVLVESMQQLVGLDVPADALAVKIKKLQDEWKELQQSGKTEDEALWLQFKEFADAAYEPCKAYFQKLAEVRQDNLVKRQGVVKQLHDFDNSYDWEKADWKMVENVLRTARKEFRDYAPVERVANEKVSAELDAVADTVFARITAEREKNKLAKEQLILQVKTLEKNTDISQSTSGVKRLQAQWKTIGQCHYRDNDVLWAAFREGCDAIFAKKNEQDAAAQSTISASIADANEMINKVKALSELLPLQPQVADSALQQLRSDFSAIDELPEQVARAVTRDFNAAVDKVHTDIGSSNQQLNELAWQKVFNLSAEINAITRLDIADRTEAKASIEETLADVRWPEGAKQPVLAKLASSIDFAVSDLDLSTNAKNLRILCIRAEMLANSASPNSDSALRMEYQMTLLKDGVRYQCDPETILALAIDWINVGAVDAGEQEVLFKRFYASWSRLNV